MKIEMIRRGSAKADPLRCVLRGKYLLKNIVIQIKSVEKNADL